MHRVCLVSELTCVRKGLLLSHGQGRCQITELSALPSAKALGLPAIFRNQEGVFCSLRSDDCINENCKGISIQRIE